MNRYPTRKTTIGYQTEYIPKDATPSTTTRSRKKATPSGSKLHEAATVDESHDEFNERAHHESTVRESAAVTSNIIKGLKSSDGNIGILEDVATITSKGFASSELKIGTSFVGTEYGNVNDNRKRKSFGGTGTKLSYQNAVGVRSMNSPGGFNNKNIHVNGGSRFVKRTKGSNGFEEENFIGNLGNDKEKVITPIAKVDPKLDNVCIQGRCISIWQSHRLNAEHDPYSLDLVLQDIHNSRIQVSIKKEFMFRFEPLFEEGQCYLLSNFGIAENSGKLPLLPHSFKISLYRYSTVTRIDQIDDNPNGFIFEPFSQLLDTDQYEYPENDAVDVIGSVVGIGDVIPVRSASGKKVRRTIVLEDVEGERLDLTFWDSWATLWDQFATKRETINHLVIILQLGKVKYWDGVPAIHNALFGTQIYSNPKMPEIVAFKKRVEEREGFDSNKLKIKLVTPEAKVVTIGEFFHGCVKKMIGCIRECQPDTHCIVYGSIHKIHKEHGWAYTACKVCNKRVDIVHRQNRAPIYVCEDHGNVQGISRFKVIVRVVDESGSAPLLFFNNNFVKLSGHTSWELMEEHGIDTNDYCPQELDKIVGKKCLFKIFFSEYNAIKNNHTYRCDSFSEDDELINHFKKTFLQEESDNEGEDDMVSVGSMEEPNEEYTTKGNESVVQNKSTLTPLNIEKEDDTTSEKQQSNANNTNTNE